MMKTNPKVGLLPLYLKLYDDSVPEAREQFRPFLESAVKAFEEQGIDVVRGEVCSLAAEFKKAVALFEKEGVHCIVTLHLAYSPSLESIDALTKTNLPILILDTTMDACFGRDAGADRIMYNHGIHGVMDLACMLRRRGKSFEIVAGHVTQSDVMARSAAIAGAAYGAWCFKNTKALRVGEAFKGMGDFSVDEHVLRDALGISVEQIRCEDLEGEVEAVTQEETKEEIARDRERFICDLPAEVHARSVRIGLGLRRKLEAGEYSAFSMNFLAFDRPDGVLNAVPFLEASKAMARGTGYAGEGDVLTAALVGALSRAFGNTTFTEIFCPDWNGNSLFLSHMGEVNPDIASDKPRLVEKPFPYTPAQNPAILACAPKPGPAVFVNLAPGPNNTFTLIAAPVEILGDTTTDGMRDAIRGWMRPSCGVEAFLQEYSRHGGTHHSALVLGEKKGAVEAFAGFLGMGCTIIE